MWMRALMLSTNAFAAEVVKDQCDGKIGAEQLDCIKEHYPADFATVEAACADAESGTRRDCRIAQYSTLKIIFVGNPERGDAAGSSEGGSSGHSSLNESALTAGATTLRVAGAGLQAAPTLCGLSKKCKLTGKDKGLISGFSGVLNDVGTQVPKILQGNGSESDKASKLLGLASRLQAGVPTGLSKSGQTMVQSGVTAVQKFMPVLLSVGGKK